MTEDRMRHQFADYLSKAEVAIYSIVAVVVVLTALVTIASSAKILWDGLSHWSLAAQTIRALNELLIVLMLVEILHTVLHFHSLAYSRRHRAIPRRRLTPP
jgi:uncharacterized membrane protein (DUF373 family)